MTTKDITKLDKVGKMELARKEANIEALAAQQVVAAFRAIGTLTNQEQVDYVDSVTKHAKVSGKALKERELKITRPINASLKATRDDFRPGLEAYAEIEEIGKSLIADFYTRMNALKTTAYSAGVALLQAGDQVGGQQALAASAEAYAAATPEGTSLRYVWESTIDNPDLVPRELCSPDPKKIRAYLAQWPVEKAAPEVPGISIARMPTVTMQAGEFE